MLNRLRRLASLVTVWWLVAIPLCGCLCELWWLLHSAQHSAQLVETAIGWWFDCREHHACLTSDVLGTFGAVEKAAGQSAIASKETVAMLQDVHPRVNAVLDESAATLREARTTLKAATTLVDSMRAGLDQLTNDGENLVQSSTVAVQALTTALDEIDGLTQKLAQQIDAGSPLALQTVTDFDAALKHLDALLADPDVAATLAHVNKTSGHLEESAASIDTALRPWREKAHLLKAILGKTWELLEHALPLLRR